MAVARINWGSLLLMACGSVASVLAYAQVSVLVQPGTVTGSFHAADFAGNASANVLLTVPSGRTARITDVLMHSSLVQLGRRCLVRVSCGSQQLFFMGEGGTSLHTPLNNGLGCTAGSTVEASFFSAAGSGIPADQHGGSDAPFVTVRGYYVTVP